MKKRKNLHINEGLWEKAKLLVKYKNIKERNDIDLNDHTCILVEQWVGKEMKKLKEDDPEMFEAIEVTASEKENAAKKLENIFEKTKLEVLKNTDNKDQS